MLRDKNLMKRKLPNNLELNSNSNDSSAFYSKKSGSSVYSNAAVARCLLNNSSMVNSKEGFRKQVENRRHNQIAEMKN